MALQKSAPKQSAPKYTIPDVLICTRGKRWYLEYYIKENGKRIRQRRYFGINRIKDKKLRFQAFQQYREEIISELRAGKLPKKKSEIAFEDVSSKTITEFITQIISEKKQYQKFSANKSTATHLKHFSKWLITQGMGKTVAAGITKNHIAKYRNSLMRGRANRTVNNYMIDISALFNYLKTQYEDVITKNPCEGISFLPVRSETNVAYTDEQVIKLRDWLEKNEPETLLFTRFIVYCFMRINETLNIRCGDIDLKNKRILCSAENQKTGQRMYKIIDDLFLPELEEMQLHKYPKDYYLFTLTGRPGPKPVSENYFRRRFKKAKQYFKFDKNYTMYGLRHTFVCQLLQNKAEWTAVMNRTGHTDMKSFEKYARSLLGGKYTYLSDKYSVKY